MATPMGRTVTSTIDGCGQTLARPLLLTQGSIATMRPGSAAPVAGQFVSI